MSRKLVNADELTPAAQRALDFAAQWQTPCIGAELEPPQILLGLLAEPECRAALLLTAQGIDAAKARRRWPEYQPTEPKTEQPAPLSAAARAALHAARACLADYPQPLVLATEHLLLGLAVSPGEVSDWLGEQGLQADELEAEVHRLSGQLPDALPIELGDIVAEAPPRERDESAHVDPRARAASGAERDTFVARDIAAPRADERVAVLRILDAAANRAGEALRVVEDYARFALDDRFLTDQCKRMRHELTAALAVFGDAARHAARETIADVGTTLTLASEQSRSGLREVLAASFKRLEQALRSLEEFSKTLEPATATAIERLRYRAYTLERALQITRDSGERLANAQLYVLVDGRASLPVFRQLVGQLVGAGVDVLQLRDKQLADRELLERARHLRELTAGTRTLFVMNDRPDLAALARADGVHVGQEELNVKDVRTIVGPEMLVGVSTHSLAQAQQAVLAGASYIGIGPTFPSQTKTFRQFPGLELLGQVGSQIRLPAFAIGGITAGNVAQVRAAGIGRIAVGAAVVASADPAGEVGRLQQLLR